MESAIALRSRSISARSAARVDSGSAGRLAAADVAAPVAAEVVAEVAALVSDSAGAAAVAGDVAAGFGFGGGGMIGGAAQLASGNPASIIPVQKRSVPRERGFDIGAS